MRDLREYAKQTQARLVLGMFFLVFVVGLGLIYIFYGSSGAITGLLCTLAALAPVGLIVIILWLMDWIVRRANKD